MVVTLGLKRIELVYFGYNEMDVPVIEAIHSPKHVFETVDEFNMYYHKHKSELDPLTTNKLNKMFQIKGYKITKLNGVLSLKKFDPKTDKYYYSQADQDRFRNEELNQLRDEMQKQIDSIKDSVNKIIHFLNPGEGEQ